MSKTDYIDDSEQREISHDLEVDRLEYQEIIKPALARYKQRIKAVVIERMAKHVKDGTNATAQRTEYFGGKHTECQWFINLIDGIIEPEDTDKKL